MGFELAAWLIERTLRLFFLLRYRQHTAAVDSRARRKALSFAVRRLFDMTTRQAAGLAAAAGFAACLCAIALSFRAPTPAADQKPMLTEEQLRSREAVALHMRRAAAAGLSSAEFQQGMTFVGPWAARREER